jgi:hypothetical protein
MTRAYQLWSALDAPDQTVVNQEEHITLDVFHRFTRLEISGQHQEAEMSAIAPTKGYLGTPLAEFSTQQLVDGLLYGFGFRIGSNMRCSDSYVTKSFKPDVQTRFDNDHCKKWFPCDYLL